MSTKLFILSAIIALCYITPNESLDCSKFVKIESKSLLSFLATLTFDAPSPSNSSDENNGDRWHLEMSTDLPFTFLGVWRAWAQSWPSEKRISVKSRNDSSDRELGPVFTGDQISFRLRMSFARNTKMPEINSIRWNGTQEICS